MKIFIESVRLGFGNEKSKFAHQLAQVEAHLREQQLNSRDVKWLQSSSDNYITLTAIVG